MKEKYIKFILENVPKVLTQIDRDEDSPTFGCCDRNYWHLKIRDFSSAILQQSGLTLALIYSLDFEGNKYYQNDNFYKWAVGTLEFWKKIQLRDGSFNEYYPNEHGFPPTAFSLFSTAETYKILKLEDNNLIASMRKTARYLSKTIEEKAFNQEIASIAALYSYYTIAKEEWVLEGLNKKLDRIVSLQSEEGWFPEYGGADFGYLSVALDMLAEYYWQSKDDKVLEPLRKVPEFLSYFCHPDGTIGGEYGSRNTVYFLPNGLEVLSNLDNKSAIAIRNHIYKNIGQNNYFQNSIDDRYFSHYVLHSFLRALAKNNNSQIKNDISLPCEEKHRKYFRDSRLFTLKNDNYYAVVGLNKGGTIKVFDKQEEVFSDFGYRIIKSENKIATTNWLDENYKIKVDNNKLEISGQFNLIKGQVSSPLKHFILRCASLLFGNSIIGMLKNKLIFVDNNIDVNFKRTIELQEEVIIIEDIIKSERVIKELKSASNFSLRHVASGKFYKETDLMNNSGRVKVNNLKQLIVKQEFDIKDKQVIKSIDKISEV
ncbi:hypothetical protein [Orenia marismortui]|uniref:hypothetical protein n=1 Tax=Orenia marismortui TaxID=46469 RepID=UPI000375B087|nr:hypothetical protein [Orenia marismortui]